MNIVYVGMLGIGCLALLPLIACLVSGIRSGQRKRRREQMLDRFYSKLH